MTKVLVIDDEAVVREVITAMLAGSGYEVVCAVDRGRGPGALRGREHPAS